MQAQDLSALIRVPDGTDPHDCSVCRNRTVHKRFALKGTEIAVLVCEKCGKEVTVMP